MKLSFNFKILLYLILLKAAHEQENYAPKNRQNLYILNLLLHCKISHYFIFIRSTWKWQGVLPKRRFYKLFKI